MIVHLIKRRRPLKNGRTSTVWTLRWNSSSGEACTESLGPCRKMTRAEAEERRRQKIVDLSNGVVLRDRPQRMTLQEYEDYHASAVGAKVRPSTIREYRHAMAHARRALGDDFRIDRLAPGHVGLIEKALVKLSPSTTNKTLRSLRAQFNRAVRWKLIPSNPFSGWDMPKPRKRDARIFSVIEIEAMINATPDTWWATFIRVAADTGLRRGELLALRWCDVDLDAGEVHVRGRRAASFEVRDETLPIFAWSPKAAASERTVPLTDAAVAALHRQRMKTADSAYVFLSVDRVRQMASHADEHGALPAKFDIRPNILRDFRTIQRRAHEALERGAASPAGASKVQWPIGTLHDLRKTWTTRLAATLPVHVLRQYAGHADVKTTLEHYTSVTDSDADRVRAALSAG